MQTCSKMKADSELKITFKNVPTKSCVNLYNKRPLTSTIGHQALAYYYFYTYLRLEKSACNIIVFVVVVVSFLLNYVFKVVINLFMYVCLLTLYILPIHIALRKRRN